MVYGLDIINEDEMNSMCELYSDNVSLYDIIVTSTGNLTHEQFEHLENHFSHVLSRIHDFRSKFKLSITARDYKNLISLVQVMHPLMKLSMLDCISLKVIDPLNKANLRAMTKFITKSIAGCHMRKVELSVYYEEIPTAQETFDMVNCIIKKNPRLKKFTLLHRNTDDHEEILEEAFEMLRKVKLWTDLRFEVDKEKRSIYEQL